MINFGFFDEKISDNITKDGSDMLKTMNNAFRAFSRKFKIKNIYNN